MKINYRIQMCVLAILLLAGAVVCGTAATKSGV